MNPKGINTSSTCYMIINFASIEVNDNAELYILIFCQNKHEFWSIPVKSLSNRGGRFCKGGRKTLSFAQQVVKIGDFADTFTLLSNHIKAPQL